MKCVIHIGTEKTASTLLQNWLYENEQALSAQGVALTSSGGRTNNRLLVAQFQNETDDWIKMQIAKAMRTGGKGFGEGVKAALSSEIRRKSKSHSQFVFTSEHFHSRMKSVASIAAFKAYLDPYFDEFSIVCFFREQAKVRTSLYSTALKTGAVQSIEEFHAGVNNQSHYYNYFDFFGKWEQVFGQNALKARLFDEAHLTGGDIRRDFLASALPQVDPARLSFETKSANESLSAQKAQLTRAINLARPRRAALLRKQIRSFDFLTEETPIYDPRQEEMYDQFNETNIAFFERYFGVAENLFKRPKTQAPLDKPSQDVDQMEKLLTHILSIKGLTAVRDDEVELLRVLTKRLRNSGKRLKKRATTLIQFGKPSLADIMGEKSMTENTIDIEALANEYDVSQSVMESFVRRFAPGQVAAGTYTANSDVMLFVHIPKTAGESVGRSFQDVFDRFHSITWDNVHKSFRARTREATYAMSQSELRQVIMGHFDWGELQIWRNHDLEMKCGTIFREPVARVVSNYDYNCSKAHPNHESFMARFPTLNDYVESLGFDEQLTQSIGMVVSFEMVLEKLTRYYTFLGLTEYLGASLQHLSRSHGLRNFEEYNRNVCTSTSRQSLVPDDVTKHILAVSQNDIKIHRLMSTLYERRD